MDNFILGSLIALFLYQANCSGVEVVNSYNPVDYVKIINQINTEMEKKISKHYSIEMLPGYSKTADWFSQPLLQFEIIGPLTKEELRVLLIETAKDFLSTINSEMELRSVFKKYPIQLNEIDIGILIFDKDETLVHHPDILSASLHNGKLYFHTVDKEVFLNIKQQR